METRRFKMLASKPRILAGCRSGSVDIVQKTISTSKHSPEFSKSKRSKLARQEKQFARALEMQQQRLDHFQEDLKRVEEERDQALHELREMKILAEDANARLREALSSRNTREIYKELNAVKESLNESNRDLKIKEKDMEYLKLELEKANHSQHGLHERDALIDNLKEELRNAKSTESQNVGLMSRSDQRVQELEAEIVKGKESERKMYHSLAAQTKQLEQTKIALEESKLEVASLHEKSEVLLQGHYTETLKEALEGLKSELQLTKENMCRARERERSALSKAGGLIEEVGSLKNELNLAVEAEEKSRKAMDDLALALKEVATEANRVKEKLSATELELGRAKEEAERSRQAEKITGDKYQGLSSELKLENERLKNTIERLRTEAEDSLLAWNDKEVGFVSCIKSAEEERAAAQLESSRLLSSIRETESLAQTSREENHKLRDILKHALNEANAAKDAADIARAENSQLKDCLGEKDNALDILTRENESLRINEAAARENVKEFKRLLSAASANHKEIGGMLEEHCSMLISDQKSGKKLNKAFSFDLVELRLPNKDAVVEQEDPAKAEALRGSIFDNLAESPKSAAGHHHRKGSSFAFTTDDGEAISSEDGNNIEDVENGRSSLMGRKRALLQKFGSLLRRSSFHHRKEPSME